MNYWRNYNSRVLLQTNEPGKMHGYIFQGQRESQNEECTCNLERTIHGDIRRNEVPAHFRCTDCEHTGNLPFQHKVSMQGPYEFNHTAGVYVNFCRDHGVDVHMFYNIVCMGTGCQIELNIRRGKESQSTYGLSLI